IKMRRCTACGSPIELWEADGIHTVISGDGVRAGSGRGGSKGVGEDSLARYSLNFMSEFPHDTLPNFRELLGNFNAKDTSVGGINKDTVRIAVLDTGIDTTRFVSSKYLWRNKADAGDGADRDGNCYKDDITGWNFVDNTANISDNNLSIHGTIVSQYIINQFKNSPDHTVEIMSLKTHDSHGYGDLFGSLCAIYYAMDKGAQIINASWGFYNYEDNPVPYLDSVITKVLPRKGILFVTAAGNKIQQDDQYASSLYSQTHNGSMIAPEQLRNLNVHNFYPACLSARQNNVITTTTTDGNMVSPTQNHADNYVDLGIKADSVTPNSMKFKLPFLLSTPKYISGSSFATAIASGKIGAKLKKQIFVAGINKTIVFNAFDPGIIRISGSLKNNHLISGGQYAIP
ncbi:MAG: S8 family serine peptidase, partial [Flavitalea sp.]